MYACVRIKGFMFPFNNILVSSRPKSAVNTSHLAKLKLTARKNLHIIIVDIVLYLSAATSSFLTLTEFLSRKKICNSGSCCEIAACKISPKNVSNEAFQSQFEILMILHVPLIVLR